jgi:hypothetical protein
LNGAFRALLGLAVSASGLSAQAIPSPDTGVAQTRNARSPADSPNPNGARQSSLGLVLTFADGQPVALATATARSIIPGEPEVTFSATSDTDGYLRFDSLTKGTYEVKVDYSRGRSVIRRVVVDEPFLGSIVVPGEFGFRSPAQLRWTVACLFLYLLSILFTRWHHIAKSLHAMLLQQLTTLSIRLKTEVGGSSPPEVRALQETVEQLHEGMQGSWKRARPLEFVFWSRGREHATWVAVHEVERQLAAFLAPPEQVEAYLRWADAELRIINKPGATAVADGIRLSLQPCEESQIASREKTRKALLGRAISVINNDRDTSFATLMEWQNKSSWLILTALLIIAFLTAIAGNAVLFIAGAAGGYMSRLMRALRREDLPLDYGASWTTLFLSPLFGALVGWFGIALIRLLAEPELGVLGTAFQLIRWDNAAGPAALSIAFLLGFSERFFDAIVGAVERHAIRDQAAQRTQVPTMGSPSPVGPLSVERSPSTTSARAALENSGGAGALSAATTPPRITAVDRLQRSTGDSVDAVRIRGNGFSRTATVKVNDVVREAVIESSDTIQLLLTENDIQQIDIGGDFLIQITNPDGIVSNAFDFS